MNISQWLLSLKKYLLPSMPESIQFTYCLPGGHQIVGKWFLLCEDDPKELLRKETKAINYEGQPGPGGYPADGHGGAYIVKTLDGNLASIPFKLRNQTAIYLRIK